MRGVGAVDPTATGVAAAQRREVEPLVAGLGRVIAAETAPAPLTGDERSSRSQAAGALVKTLLLIHGRPSHSMMGTPLCPSSSER